MADTKISALPAATTPLAGTEVLPIVQGGTTDQVSVANLTAGRDISARTLTSTVATGTAPLTVSSTTQVANLNAATAGTASNLLSNATTGVLQVTGPGAGTTRVMTTPNANFTAARTDAAQSFTGDQTLSTGNLIQGTAAKGVNYTANTPAAGMSSQLLNWYEEGTWTPTQGAGLTVVGAFSSGGLYTRIGRTVTVSGFVAGATSVACSSLSALCGGLPFSTKSGSVVSTGISWTPKPESSPLYVSSTTNNVICVLAIAATTSINFTITFTV